MTSLQLISSRHTVGRMAMLQANRAYPHSQPVRSPAVAVGSSEAIPTTSRVYIPPGQRVVSWTAPAASPVKASPVKIPVASPHSPAVGSPPARVIVTKALATSS